MSSSHGMGDYNEFRDEFEVEGTSISPNRLRGLVNKLIASTDIKITEFQRIIGVNANSYGRFMTGKVRERRARGALGLGGSKFVPWSW